MYWHTVGARFSKRHASPNRGENNELVPKSILQNFVALCVQSGPPIKKRRDNPRDLEFGIQASHPVNCVEKMPRPTKSLYLALHWDQNLVRSHQHIYRDVSKRGRRIYENQVVGRRDLLHDLPQLELSPDLRRKQEVCRGQVNRRRKDIQSMHADYRWDCVMQKSIEETRLEAVGFDSEKLGQRSLRICVD